MNYKRFSIVLFAAFVAAFAGTAGAALVPFDISPDLPVQPAGVIPGGNNIGSPFTYYNIQYVIDGGAADINIRTARADAPGGPGVDQVVSDGFNGSSIVIKGANSYLNTPFALGDVIGDGAGEFVRDPDFFSVINDGGTQNFAEGSNYLGIKLASGNYGFVHVLYQAASSTYTFTDGMYESSGASITAGIPEPTAISLLFIGGSLGLITCADVNR